MMIIKSTLQNLLGSLTEVGRMLGVPRPSKYIAIIKTLKFFVEHDENNRFLIVTQRKWQYMIIDRYVLVQTCKESQNNIPFIKDGEQVAYIQITSWMLACRCANCGVLKGFLYREALRGDGRFEMMSA